MTLKFSEARPYLFPPTARRLKRENERRVMNVKGAERISFSVHRAAFLLSWPNQAIYFSLFHFVVIFCLTLIELSNDR